MLKNVIGYAINLVVLTFIVVLILFLFAQLWEKYPPANYINSLYSKIKSKIMYYFYKYI